MSASEAFMALVCGASLGLIVLNIAGIRGLIVIGAEVAACGIIGWIIDARDASARRRAVRSMWRQ
jgi:hypothetical protein